MQFTFNELTEEHKRQASEEIKEFSLKSIGLRREIVSAHISYVSSLEVAVRNGFCIEFIEPAIWLRMRRFPKYRFVQNSWRSTFYFKSARPSLYEDEVVVELCERADKLRKIFPSSDTVLQISVASKESNYDLDKYAQNVYGWFIKKVDWYWRYVNTPEYIVEQTEFGKSCLFNGEGFLERVKVEE